MNLIKKYFDTPKMPMKFYYTPYFALFIAIFLKNLWLGTTVFGWIFYIVMFVLGTYTYAWLTDYILFTSNNPFLRYHFARSVLFRRDFFSIVGHAHLSQSPVYEFRNNRLQEDHFARAKGTFLSVLINIVFKFILAFILLPVFYISVFTHPFIIKKYRAKIAEAEAYQNAQENQNL